MLDRLTERDQLTQLSLGAAMAILLLATSWCIWIVVRTTWFYLAASDDPSASASDRVAISQAIKSSDREVDLAALHLFGRADQGGQAVAVSAPSTSLSLTLVGTLAGEDADTGTAIIAHNQIERAYKVGDELPGDARLHEVYADRVILTREGRYESLTLRQDDSETAIARTNQVPATLRPQPQPNIDWQAIQQQTRLDPVQLAQQIRAMPFTENGQQIGVRLQAGRDATLMRKLGLRNSDIVTAVNGIPLDNPSRQLELMRQLQSQSRFAVTVRRDGRQMTLNIDLSDLSGS